MDRRDVLKFTALATGAAVAAPLAFTLSSCQSELGSVAKTIKYIPSYFNKEEFTNLKKIIDVILPQTDSPSATQVGVHKMIDAMVGKVYKKEDQQHYRKGFDTLMVFLKEKGDSGFYKLSELDQKNELNKLEIGQSEALEEARRAYKDLKQQSIAYYLATEEVGTKHLNYLPVPGPYEGCIKLESVGGKKWAI